jgi:hypothetical protein
VVVDFTDAEFAVLDLATEDAEALGHLVYLGRDKPQPDEATAVLSSLVQRGLLVVFARSEDDEPLGTNAALHALSDLGQLTGDGTTGLWWQYHAMTTAAGDDAYRRAYNERS